MKVIKLKLLCITAALFIFQSSYADIGVSVTAAKTDYTIGWASPVQDGSGEVEGNDFVDTDFIGRDLTLDYAFEEHQFGVKIGGLSSESPVLSYELAEGFSNSGKRDEWSLFYTYRLDNGFAITGGYYDSSFEIEDNYTYSGIEGTTDFKVENSGYFAGASYAMSFSENIGGFVRLAYQLSDVNLEYFDTFDGDDYLDLGETTGTAFVLGAGIYYVLGESSSVTLFYDAKNFSYDKFVWEQEEGLTSYEEDMSSLGLSFRYTL